MQSISEKHFKKAANRLLKELLKYPNPEEISPSQGLQILSQALYKKPYEEIKKTILSSEKKEGHSVVIINAASDSLLFVDGKYIEGDFPRSDVELPKNTLHNIAERFASEYETQVVVYNIPIRDIEHWENDDVITRAEQMGCFKAEPNIFSLLSDSESAAFIGNNYCPYKISDDWISTVENEDEDSPIWFIEYTEDDEFYEFFISFKELCEAVYMGNNTWLVKEGEETLQINFKK